MNTDHLHFRLAHPDDKKDWDHYVLSHPDGLAYHLYAWKEAVESAYGFDCPYFLAEQNAQICGVLPTAHIHLPFRPGYLVSLPYCDVGGALADSPEIANQLLSYAISYADKNSIPKLEARSSYPTQLSNYQIPHKVRMLLSLPKSSEALMSSFKSKLRSQVKKPFRDGLSAKLGGLELLDQFYPVFCQNMRDLGSPVHSRDWIFNVLKYFGDRGLCGLVYMPDGSPAACGMILLHHQTVSIPWASSLKAFNRYNPNMLLYWSFLEYAADNGYKFFDFGRSTPDEGTYKFKAQWGAKPHPLYWVKFWLTKDKVQPVREKIASNSNGRSRDMAEKMIRNIPVPVATFLGSRVRKYISL